MQYFFSIICYNNFELYKKFRVDILDILGIKSMFWVRNQYITFVNLFADRIIRETSENTGFYRSVVFYQIMAKFLLLDFLILDHVRKARVTSIVFHKSLNFEMPFRHNSLCYDRSESHWEILSTNYELLRWVFDES